MEPHSCYLADGKCHAVPRLFLVVILSSYRLKKVGLCFISTYIYVDNAYHLVVSVSTGSTPGKFKWKEGEGMGKEGLGGWTLGKERASFFLIVLELNVSFILRMFPSSTHF